MRLHIALLTIALLATASAQESCIELTADEVCITKTFPTCTATWNGVPCESCTVCGEDEDAATAYTCEVASIVSSGQCTNTCANVECNAGCTQCQIAQEDVPAAITAYEARQAELEEQEEAGVEGDFPLPVPSPQGDFPVPVPASSPGIPVTASVTVNNETTDSTLIPVVIDNNTNEATQEEEQPEETEQETEPPSGVNATDVPDGAEGGDVPTETDAEKPEETAPSDPETTEGQGEQAEEDSGSVRSRRQSFVAVGLLALSSVV